MRPRRVLGVDPGFDRLGLAVLEGDPSRPSWVWSACVTPPKGTPAERLAQVARAVRDALRAHEPQALAIETLFFSSNRSTALPVAEARGVILAEAGAAGIPVIECSPQTVKLAVTGSGRADKAAIARMLPKLLTLPERRYLDDELDAVAVAIAGLTLARG